MTMRFFARLIKRASTGCVLIVFGALFIAPVSAFPVDTASLFRLTDVPMVIAATERARADADSLAQVATKQNDKQHLQKAAQAFAAAIEVGFTVSTIDSFFIVARPGVQELEATQSLKIEARAVASALAEAIRVATQGVLDNADAGLSMATDTRTVKEERRALARAREAYLRGVSALDADRRTDALNHFRKAFDPIGRVLELLPPAVASIRTEFKTDPNVNPLSWAAFDAMGRVTAYYTDAEFRFPLSGIVLSRKRGERFVESADGQYFAIRKANIGNEHSASGTYALALHDSFGALIYHRDGLQSGTLLAGRRILTSSSVPDEINDMIILGPDGSIISKSKLSFDAGMSMTNGISPSGDHVVASVIARLNRTRTKLTYLINMTSGESVVITPEIGAVSFVGNDRFTLANGGSGGVKYYDLNGMNIWTTPIGDGDVQGVNSAADGGFISVALDDSLYLLDTIDGSLEWSADFAYYELDSSKPAVSNDARTVGVDIKYPRRGAAIFNRNGSRIVRYFAEDTDFSHPATNFYGKLRHVGLHVSADGATIHLFTAARIIRLTLGL